eukprot:3891825-Pleurochrysis_carterae.AAC.1
MIAPGVSPMTMPGRLCLPPLSYPRYLVVGGMVGVGERGADGRGVLPGMITYVSVAHYPAQPSPPRAIALSMTAAQSTTSQCPHRSSRTAESLCRQIQAVSRRRKVLLDHHWRVQCDSQWRPSSLAPRPPGPLWVQQLHQMRNSQIVTEQPL